MNSFDKLKLDSGWSILLLDRGMTFIPCTSYLHDHRHLQAKALTSDQITEKMLSKLTKIERSVLCFAMNGKVQKIEKGKDKEKLVSLTDREMLKSMKDALAEFSPRESDVIVSRIGSAMTFAQDDFDLTYLPAVFMLDSTANMKGFIEAFNDKLTDKEKEDWVSKLPVETKGEPETLIQDVL